MPQYLHAQRDAGSNSFLVNDDHAPPRGLGEWLGAPAGLICAKFIGAALSMVRSTFDQKAW